MNLNTVLYMKYSDVELYLTLILIMIIIIIVVVDKNVLISFLLNSSILHIYFILCIFISYITTEYFVFV